MDPLSCLLSYGLMCSAAPKAAEPAPPVPSVDEFAVDPGTPAEQGAGSKVLVKVQGYYDAAADLRADFEQTYVHPVYGTKTVSKGKLRVKKPGMMVWDYHDGDYPDVWVDGERVWVVEEGTQQVIRRDLGGSDFAGVEKFLFGGRQLMDDFLVKLAGEKLVARYGLPGHTVVRLKPRVKNPHYLELVLVVDDVSGRVDAFVVLNGDRSTNHFVLTNASRNVGLSVAEMKFRKPKGFSEIAQ